MRKIILDFPKQFKTGLRAAKNLRPPVNIGYPNKVLICGMGGSALVGGILKMWLAAYKIALPLSLHRNYGLPYQSDKDQLVISISYSGNTEETLSCFDGALRKKLPLVAITSGGRLAQLCQKYKIPFAKIPKGYSARMTLGFKWGALVKILVNYGIIRDNLENIQILEKRLKPAEIENQGKELAKKLKGKIPLIYSSEQRKELALIWKINFNESSKIPAFWNYFPELNHNEIVSFVNLGKPFSVIILKDPADHPRIKKRMTLTAQILKNKGVPVNFVDIKGRDILYKIFSNILLTNWVSYYLAKQYRIDPLSTKTIEEFKKRMSRW